MEVKSLAKAPASAALSVSRGRRRGRPPSASCNGYYQQKIMAAEAAVRQLTEVQARLEADNGKQQPVLGFLDSGIAEADMHLSFMLISQSAFSRKAVDLQRREDANQVISPSVMDSTFLPMLMRCTSDGNQRTGALCNPSFSRQPSRCFMPPSHACMQVSITALPPPEQWNNHVLTYFSSMSPDRFRGLILDLQLKVCNLLPPAAQCCLEHPSYQHISNVRPTLNKVESWHGRCTC